MAFAPSTFLGTAQTPSKLRHAPAPCGTGLRMVSKPAGRSKIWEAFTEGKLGGGSSIPVPGPRVVTRGVSENALRTATTPFFLEFAQAQWRGFGDGGDAQTSMLRPVMRKADDYIADCARRQYIAKSNGSGVYGPQCTEGGAKFAAEDARVAALAAQYRAKQIPAVASFGDAFEARRRAIVLGNGCHYEEKLVSTFVGSASAVVLGSSEASKACVRYADPAGPAEKYMVDCVSRAASARAAAGGLYGVMCCDGTVKGAAEQKRVTGLAVQFRNGQKSQLEKEAAKFALPQFARQNYAHMCSYEEDLFAKYPATAAAMRPDSARY